MSGCSESTICPNCGYPSADLYIDYKPFFYSVIFCPACGLHINPRIVYSTLEELNEERAEYDLEPLEKLPEQNKDL